MMKPKIPKALLPALDTISNIRVRLLTALCAAVPIGALIVAVLLLPNGTTRPATPAEFWALVQGVSSVLILAVTFGVGAVAWYGLRSIRLARHDMVTRATRESRAMAIERAEHFSRILSVSLSAIHEDLAAAKVQPFTHLVKSGAAVFDDDEYYKPAKAWWNALPPPTRSKITWLLNDIEAWAMYFTQGLADSATVFGPCAPTYCSIVLQYSPWIIVVRKENFKGFYPNLLHMFHAWRAELDAQDRGSKTEAALLAAKAAEERRAQYPVPAPLGTRVDI